MTIMPVSPSLAGMRRIGLTKPRAGIGLADLAILLGAGAAAALASSWGGGWGIPGSKVLQGVLPMAAGLALVPRRGAGLVMGTSCVATTFALTLGHENPSVFARLFLLGLCLEVGPSRVGRNGHLWLLFVLAGLAANALGFGTKMLAANLGWEGFGAGNARFALLTTWQGQLLSFAVCGALAGGISAVIFFRRTRADDEAPEQPKERGDHAVAGN